MFLEYGVTDNDELIRIDQVARGRLSGIYCPYCHRPLLARKGEIKAPHFAHDGETCQAANRNTDDISLPVYDRFNLRLSGRELETLRYYAGLNFNLPLRELQTHSLINKNLIHDGYGGKTELTKLGKIPLGLLSLMLFNEEQEPMIREHHEALQKIAYEALGTPDFETALTDLRLYRAQWKRILSLTLYFMEITHADGILHKIGVTNRTAEERALEIAADLRPHFGDVSIKVIDTWVHRGNVELYFKYRYAAQQHRLGDLTEYFKFDDPKAVLRDLRRMKVKVLDSDEQAVMDGLPSRIEQGIPPIVPFLPLESWVMLEQHTDGVPFPLDRNNEKEGRTFNKLYWPGYYVQIDYSKFEGYVTEKGQTYHQYFADFYHQHYAEYYEGQRRAARAELKRAAIRDGMRQAAEQGKHVGRPSEDAQAFLDKPQNRAIREALERGLSLRETARETGAAVNTIRKVKAMIETSKA